MLIYSFAMDSAPVVQFVNTELHFESYAYELSPSEVSWGTNLVLILIDHRRQDVVNWLYVNMSIESRLSFSSGVQVI